MRQDVFLTRSRTPEPGSWIETTFVDHFTSGAQYDGGIFEKRYEIVTGASGPFAASVERLGCDYNSYYAIGAQLVSGSRVVHPGTSLRHCLSTIVIDLPA